MGQEQFTALMPYIITDLINFISEKDNISEEETMKKLYSSKLYEVLENEETKLWQYSTQMLYTLFEQEEKNGIIEYPDVWGDL